MKKARYICLEGGDGVGKSTQTELLVSYLKNRGYSVLQTKEPGTPLSPLTMQLRGIMLDSQYEEEITPEARELVSQAIRSIHLQKVILPALSEYDYIVQDRGMLSGLSYGSACGIGNRDLLNLSHFVTSCAVNTYSSLYDDIIYLRGDPTIGLQKALGTKQEFQAGDAMEARGSDFMKDVQDYMDDFAQKYPSLSTIDVDGKNIQEVFGLIIDTLNIKE